MKRRMVLVLVMVLLLAGSVSADRKELGEGSRSFSYLLNEDFTLENAEGEKLIYKDCTFSGDMDFMESDCTSAEGTVVIRDSEYYIFKTDSSKAKLEMGEPLGKADEWLWLVEGDNIRSIRMSARGVEVVGDDMSYEISGWEGDALVGVHGEQESRVHLAASIEKKGTNGVGVHSEKADAQVRIISALSSLEGQQDAINAPGHWTHMIHTEDGYQLNQYKGDGRFPDVVTGKREWPLYGKILVVALPVTAVVAVGIVLGKKRKNKTAQSE